MTEWNAYRSHFRTSKTLNMINAQHVKSLVGVLGINQKEISDLFHFSLAAVPELNLVGSSDMVSWPCIEWTMGATQCMSNRQRKQQKKG